MKKKRYAVCGVSARAIDMFIRPVVETYKEQAEIAAMLDIDPLRFQICKYQIPGAAGIPEYPAEQFDRMLAECRPDVIIATGVDRTHADYIVRALQAGLDVISEKPMTTTVADCLRVIDAEKASRRSVICSFNYRYAPVHFRIREMIAAGALGRITHVDLNWYIDIKHGSSYFNRWNRLRANSGGLSIHKASHHFDLVNWWIDSAPAAVHAFGALNHYGPAGEFNPSRRDGRICSYCDERPKCAYYRRWATRTGLIKVPDDHIAAFIEDGDQHKYTDYRPDMCIFDSEIDIEDTYVVNVKYRSGAFLNYSANFSTPYEGYRLAINGTRGRLESQQWHAPLRTPFPIGKGERQFIDYFPIFGSRERIWCVPIAGGHDGGDAAIREDIFLGPSEFRPAALATSADALNSIAIGEAVWRSIKDERIVKIDELIRDSRQK